MTVSKCLEDCTKRLAWDLCVYSLRTALLKQVAEEISLPAFAIGGITLENLSEVQATGIKRVAVSGAIAKAVEPGEVARLFARMLSI